MIVQVRYACGSYRYFKYVAADELKIAADDRLYVSVFGNVYVVEEVLSYESSY